MMKKLFSLIVLALFISCENEPVAIEQNDPTEPVPELVLKNIRYEKIGPSPCDGTFTDFDRNGKIAQVYRICGEETSIVRSYVYNEHDLISYFTGYLNFEYDAEGTLISRRGGTDTGSGYLNFYYDENTVRTQGYYVGEPDNWYTIYEFEDASLQRLVSIKKYDTTLDDELYFLSTFLYQENNLVEIYVERKLPEDTSIAPFSRTRITYDDQINPWKLGLPENAYLAYATVLTYSTDNSLAFHSVNNIRSYNIDDLRDGNSYTSSYEYTYNEHGYPVEALYTSREEPWHEIYYTYYE